MLPPPKEDFSNSAILLMEMYHALSEEQGRTSKATILSNRDHANTMHKETIKKLEEAAREMEKAAKASTVAKIFGWIAMAFAAIVAVAAVIVSGGALGPLVGLAVTGVMIGLQASGAMGKITEGLAKAITSMLEGMGWTRRRRSWPARSP
ncbi:MAG: type III secretion system translocon subunit SctE [Dongiaceae bacterium]